VAVTVTAPPPPPPPPRLARIEISPKTSSLKLAESASYAAIFKRLNIKAE
jgi:hypothetical protein